MARTRLQAGPAAGDQQRGDRTVQRGGPLGRGEVQPRAQTSSGRKRGFAALLVHHVVAHYCDGVCLMARSIKTECNSALYIMVHHPRFGASSAVLARTEARRAEARSSRRGDAGAPRHLPGLEASRARLEMLRCIYHNGVFYGGAPLNGVPLNGAPLNGALYIMAHVLMVRCI